jgi:hypothetical protein
MTEKEARAAVAILRNRKRFRGINAYQCELDKTHWHVGRSRFARSQRRR